MEYLLVYDYNLSWFHRDQHIVDAHSDKFRIHLMLLLLSHTILICGAVCYCQAYQRRFDKSRYTLMGVVPLSKCCVILSTRSNTASYVECSFLKPYWLQQYKSLT